MGSSEIVAERESAGFPRAFGNYLLLTSLARGGMGEVFLAKSGGIAGIEKHCVVKTLRGNYTLDREYVARFKDEARVVVQLHHRNICQIYDVGRVGKQYYLAMEYIVGRDLRTIQQRAKESGRPIRHALVLHILAEMLEALDYAHRIADPITGEPLRVVHRDVSPQNVMLNFEGEVKLIDFGLAQSAKKVEKTQPHVVMGKMAYMSPEQARGDPVDGRADQFAAAVLCYELLVGERYYEGLSFDQIWSMAGRGGHTPRLWSTLDRELARILGRALAPEQGDRYPTCADFKEDLVAYQIKTGQLAMSRDTRAFLSDLFGDESLAHREMLARFQNVRMIARESDARPDDESQRFSPSDDHESIVSAAAIEEASRAVTASPVPERSRATSTNEGVAPVKPLRPDEKTVSTLLVSNPSASAGAARGAVVVDHTVAESAPLTELVPRRTKTESGDKGRTDERTVVEGMAPESEPTAPPTAPERTEAVRVTSRAAPLAPTVIVQAPVDDVDDRPRRSLGILVALAAVGALALAVVVVFTLRSIAPSGVVALETSTRVDADVMETTPPVAPPAVPPASTVDAPTERPAERSSTPVADGLATGGANDDDRDGQAADEPTGEPTADAERVRVASTRHADEADADEAQAPPERRDTERRGTRRAPRSTPTTKGKAASGEREVASVTPPKTERPPEAAPVRRAPITLAPRPVSDSPATLLNWIRNNCRPSRLPCVTHVDNQWSEGKGLPKTGLLKQCADLCQAWAAGH